MTQAKRFAAFQVTIKRSFRAKR